MLPLSSYSTFFVEANASDRLKNFTHYFDSTTGMYLSTWKSYQSGVYLIEKDLYDKVGASIFEEPTSTGDTFADTMNILSQLNSIASAYDFSDDNLGVLTSIVFAEMQNGNDVDMRIVAESVMNRWDRRETEPDFKIGRKTVVTNLRQLIEMPRQYDAVKRRDKDTNIIIYSDILGNYEKLIEILGSFWVSVNVNPQLVKCIEISYQIYKEIIPKIYFGVTHYVSNYPSTYFDNKSQYEDLIDKDPAKTKIRGNKKVTDAARQIPE